MTSGGSVWVWVSRGGRDGDRLYVSFEDGGGAGMATGSKRSVFFGKSKSKKTRTDTEVGEDGMDAGERVMRSEFLLGDPREAGEENESRVGRKRRRNTYGRG